MPKKWLSTVSLLSLFALQTSVDAVWSSKNGNCKANNGRKEEPKTEYTEGSHVPDERSVFVEADYLFWLPHQENLFYATKASFANSINSQGQGGPGTINNRLKAPAFDLSSGVRLGIGGYNTDGWDLSARATYLYADASSTCHGDLDLSAIGPSFIPVVLGSFASKGSAHWKMNMWIFDLSLGREYYLTDRFTVHPFVGARGMINNQSFRVRYSNAQIDDFSENTGVRMHNDFWGVGPRAGIDSSYYLSKQWSILGGVAGCVYFARYDVKSKAVGFQEDDNELRSFNINYKDKRNMGRANMDAYLGLGWDHWYNKGQNRVYLALVAEGSYWWGINQLNDLDVTTVGDGGGQGGGGVPSLIFQKRHGDLSFIGGTLHFQLDF